MLNKLVAIQNVGRFRSYSAVGDVQLRRATLVYAENGRGKTTFCAILRSLATNNPALIIGRQTLGSATPQSVHLQTSDGPIVFQHGAWSSSVSNLAIFDSTYVSENVYAGDAVETEHRRSLYRVIIGAQGIAFANEITELDSRIRAQNGAIQDNRARLLPFLGRAMSVDQFIALLPDPSIDEKLATKEQELQTVLRSEDIARRAGLTPVAIPVIPVAISEVLAKTLSNVEDGALKRVREHIAKHTMEGQGEGWLSTGARLVVDNECPFCGQDVAGNVLITAYQSFFSTEYRELRRTVAELVVRVNSVIGDRAASAIVETVVQNDGAAEFWRTYCDLTPPSGVTTETVRKVFADLRGAAAALLETKAGTPLEPVPPTETYTSALRQFENLRTRLSDYNAAVAAANVLVEETRQQAKTSRRSDVEADLSRLRVQKARGTTEAALLCETEGRLQAEKTIMEGEKERARTALDSYTARVIDEYGQSINKYLNRFNAAFRITGPTHNYRGGSPSTSYQILINSRPVDLGDERTPMDRPSFKNTLSSGDRSTLALAFFLAQLDQDPGIAEKIVVFDDPFTSMDSFRRTSTVHEIHRCWRESAQIILLSHEATFLEGLWKMLPAGDRKALQFARVGEENTRITEWDIERALQSQLRADIEAIRVYHIDGSGDPRTVAQKIRLVIEGHARNVCPTQFGSSGTMGAIVEEIRSAGVSHSLFEIVDDLDQINMYSRRYHHPENPQAATEAIDDGELAGFARRTLQLVGCIP